MRRKKSLTGFKTNFLIKAKKLKTSQFTLTFTTLTKTYYNKKKGSIQWIVV